MESKTEGVRSGEFLVSEANGTRSRESVTITGGSFPAGQVLGMITASKKHTAYNSAGSDGTETAVAILYAATDASTEDKSAVAIVRDAEVSEELAAGIDAAAITELSDKGIITR